MRLTSCWLSCTAVAIGLSCVLPARAPALTFSSSCDRFEIDGNSFGPADGTIDFFDEFANGTLAPEWGILLGTASETGGHVVVSNPGVQVQLGPTPFEISTIENSLHDIEDGAGNATATAYWAPTLPSTDTEFHLQLYSISPIIEAAGLAATNVSAQVAAQQGNGTLPGYSVTQSLTHGFGPGFTTVQFNTVPINPALVTGPIVTRLSLDDTTDMLTCSFSLDGGTTFLSPFPPVHVFNSGVTDYEILIGAAALAATGSPPPPSAQTLPLDLFLVKQPFERPVRHLIYEAKTARLNPNTIVGDPTIGGATLNVKLGPATQCFMMPPSGWSGSGQSFRYTDRLGLVRVAKLKRRKHGSIVNRVSIDGTRGHVYLVPPNPGVRADTAFRIGGGATYCASTEGGTIGPNNATTFRARNAPAPASCGVPACSPSGAFLDDLDGAF